MEFRVPATDKPTYFNKDAGLGALIGGSIPFLWPVTAPAGAIIGGIVGKNRMEKEAHEGKIVKEPSFWNKDTAIGGLGGYLGGGVGTALLAGAAKAALLLVGVHVALPIAAIALVGAAAGGIIGLVKGGESGRARMDREFFEARQQGSMAPPTPARSQSQGQGVQYSYDVPDKCHAADELRRRAAQQSPETAQYLSGR